MRSLQPLLSQIDRAAELRTQPERLEQLWHTAKIYGVQRNQIATSGGVLALLSPTQQGERYFLGVVGEVAHFAVRIEGDEFDATVQWQSLREIAHLLSPLELELALHAIALVNWHSNHPHCARCGAKTFSDLGGSVRRCEIDQSEHYPRTDPAIITLVRDESDRILLGRQAVWPPRRFSTFAGFVEAGESFEAAVMRETLEEAGVAVEDVQYLGSQPWPFPASLMIAFVATTKEPEKAKADGVEIESLRWFTREELALAIETKDLILPPGISIARRMIEAWYGSPLESESAWR